MTELLSEISVTLRYGNMTSVSDGLGRALRTAKTGEVYDRASDSKRTGWNVSGAVEYDAMGRVASQGQPYFIEGGLSALALDSGIFTVPTVRPTLTEYDSLDRVIRTELPDGSVQTVEYDVTASGEPCTKTTDPLGNKSLQQTDPAGNIIFVERLDSSENSLTSATYTYNAIGEMLKATDVKGNDITASYDMLGRKLTLSSLDGGRNEYEYDAYRLISESTAAMRAQNLVSIHYLYDGLNRLVKIDYPKTADTEYEYGESGASDNAAGKVTLLTDASGTTEYKYGKLGEVTEETRTIHRRRQSSTEIDTASTGYVSNYLGQIEQLAYPDGETVTYGYDAGGNVKFLKGSHYGHTFLYVTDIGYNEQGQRAFIEYGTGVQTFYEYDENRRWLSSIETSKDGSQYQNISYEFDSVGNVLGYTNDCASYGNYSTSQSYSYDALYQLTHAEGSTSYTPYKGVKPVHTSRYTQDFSFDVLGNMTEKVSTNRIEPSQLKLGDDLNYSFAYSYAEGFAHRLDHIGNRYYKYDACGNIVLEGGADAESGKTDGTGDNDDDWVWDDESVGGGIGGGSLSGGGASGNDDDEWVWDDESVGGGIGGGSLSGGGVAGNNNNDDDWIWDDEPVNSGNGSSGDVSEEIGNTTVIRSYDWNERNQMVRSINGSTEAWYVYGADGQRTNKYTSSSETVYFSRFWAWRGESAFTPQNIKNIYLGESRLVTKINSETGHDSYSEELHKTYYYHSDHLGSAQLITDWQGMEYQRIEYTPYGETWVEKTENTYEYLPYKFTGKELDDETGLYYYGARYLDAKFSLWTSTDPALGEYLPKAGADNSNLPGMGGVFNTTNSHLYHYANNNPITYTDPDGRKVIVGISTSDSLWGKCIGNHVFIMCINEDIPEKSLMLDASGHYGKGRSADILNGQQ